ncbi:MAG: glutaminyl-tRNA synthetase [Flavobacteriales bacterium]|jgi:glutaminyl-tRNA synthetase
MSEETRPKNFLEQIITKDLADGVVTNVVTRFPPEPNGYLHVGHAKSICLNFGLAQQFGGVCNLRFDDTNPEKESQEYVDAIQQDVRWLGFDWNGEIKFASDYFEQFYQWALELINANKAYVCQLDAEQTRQYRGDFTTPGKNSPYQNRPLAENIALLAKMRAGEMAEGSATLRAKIDMQHPNLTMRDPVLYRIRHVAHHRTGNEWNIYPAYDFAHGQEDAIEGVSHSICTLEFQDHRPLYEWFTENLSVPSSPKQYEFARLNLNYTVTSKRKLKQLVDDGVVAGWDDPRMPTIAGMRRRGYSPAAIRNFCEKIGVTRADSVVDMAELDFTLREDLNDNAPRAMCVLDPVKLTITNFAATVVEVMTVPAHPNKPEMGERELPFTKELYIDRADFTEDNTLSRKKFKRLVLGEWVRLRGSYVIKADDVVKDDSGNIVEIIASLLPDTVGNNPPEGMKPRGVIHWVSATKGVQATVRLYDRLFNVPAPDRGDSEFMDHVNAESFSVIDNAWVEPSLADAKPEQRFQFEREGYFVADRLEHSEAKPVFNKTIGLRDTWAKG